MPIATELRGARCGENAAPLRGTGHGSSPGASVGHRILYEGSRRAGETGDHTIRSCGHRSEVPRNGPGIARGAQSGPPDSSRHRLDEVWWSPRGRYSAAFFGKLLEGSSRGGLGARLTKQALFSALSGDRRWGIGEVTCVIAKNSLSAVIGQRAIFSWFRPIVMGAEYSSQKLRARTVNERIQHLLKWEYRLRKPAGFFTHVA